MTFDTRQFGTTLNRQSEFYRNGWALETGRRLVGTSDWCCALLVGLALTEFFAGVRVQDALERGRKSMASMASMNLVGLRRG